MKICRKLRGEHQLYSNHSSACVFFCKLAGYFTRTSSTESFWHSQEKTHSAYDRESHLKTWLLTVILVLYIKQLYNTSNFYENVHEYNFDWLSPYQHKTLLFVDRPGTRFYVCLRNTTIWMIGFATELKRARYWKTIPMRWL